MAAWRHEPDWLETPSWEHEAAEHRAVLQAAEDGDAQRAATLLRGHIVSFVERNFPSHAGGSQMSLTPAAAEALRHALATAVVVPVTPLQADGNPDWDAYAALTGRLIDGGIKILREWDLA